MTRDEPQVPFGSLSWPPSMETLGAEGPVCLSFSTCGCGHRVGHGVPSNGVLNGHPSFSVDSYALRANQMECLRDS